MEALHVEIMQACPIHLQIGLANVWIIWWLFCLNDWEIKGKNAPESMMPNWPSCLNGPNCGQNRPQCWSCGGQYWYKYTDYAIFRILHKLQGDIFAMADRELSGCLLYKLTCSIYNFIYYVTVVRNFRCILTDKCVTVFQHHRETC